MARRKRTVSADPAPRDPIGEAAERLASEQGESAPPGNALILGVSLSPVRLEEIRRKFWDRYTRSIARGMEKAAGEAAEHEKAMGRAYQAGPDIAKLRVPIHEKALERSKDALRTGRLSLSVYNGEIEEGPAGARFRAVFRSLRERKVGVMAAIESAHAVLLDAEANASASSLADKAWLRIEADKSEKA
jgi:hypothetical protein